MFGVVWLLSPTHPLFILACSKPHPQFFPLPVISPYFFAHVLPVLRSFLYFYGTRIFLHGTLVWLSYALDTQKGPRKTPRGVSYGELEAFQSAGATPFDVV
jgi:hypothetical protein